MADGWPGPTDGGPRCRAAGGPAGGAGGQGGPFPPAPGEECCRGRVSTRSCWRRRPGPIAAERILLLRDATGYEEPLAGERMGWALGAAVAVAPVVVRNAPATLLPGPLGPAATPPGRPAPAPAERADSVASPAEAPACERPCLAYSGALSGLRHHVLGHDPLHPRSPAPSGRTGTLAGPGVRSGAHGRGCPSGLNVGKSVYPAAVGADHTVTGASGVRGQWWANRSTRSGLVM